MNPSFEFEHGGLMPNGYDISGWDTWGMPDNWAWRNFGNTNGHGVRVDALSSGWSSDGDWSLYIFASTAGNHEPGHYIEFYQFVDLTDVDAIVFDVRLRGGIYTNSYFAVDSQKVWVHNQAGWLPNVIVDVGNFSGIRKIALGVEVFEAFGDTADGWTHFDNIRAVLDPATLLGIEIVGPEEVTENFSASFKAIAYNDNDITADITDWVIWSVEPQTYASIDENGLLHTGDIDIPQDITIYAKYTIGDVTFEADTIVRITLPYTLYVPTEYNTIQAAIDAASDGDVVIVADGTYTGPFNRDIDFLGKAITVRSENGPNNCIIDCETLGRGFYFHRYERANSLVEGFTITNGNATYGGAIFCRRSSPTIANCIITGNYGNNYGGGIACRYRCSPTITNCIISGNSARYDGGAIFCRNSSPTITNCTISSNLSEGNAGAIFCRNSSPTITNCTITTNSAEWGGGGIYCDFGSNPTITNCSISGNIAEHGFGGAISLWWESNPTISNCTISGNNAADGDGGAISCLNGSNPVITNCAISDNTAEWDGGGIYCRYSSPTIKNCRISGNTAAKGRGLVRYGGGGICCEGDLGLSSSPIISNCIIAGNSSDDIGGGILCKDSSPTISNCTISSNLAIYGGGGIYFENQGSSIIANCIIWENSPQQITGISSVTYSDVQGSWPGEGNVDADPCFVEPGYWADANDPNIIVEPNDPNAVWIGGDYYLLPDSLCIDAGDPNYVAEPNETDIDGNPRVINGRIDMGAYETNHIQAAMKLTPQMLNCNSKGKYIKAHLTLPEGFLPEDVDVNEPAIAEPIGAESEYIDVFGNKDSPVRLEICFDREAFCDGLTDTDDDSLEVTVIGSLTTSRYFDATDTIKIKP